MTNVERRAVIHAALGEPVRLAIVDNLVLGDASPSELGGSLRLASNLLAFHLGVLDQAGIVRRVRSEGDRRRQYVQLRLDDPVVAALTRPVPTETFTETLANALHRTRRVVFVCTANSVRSQLAAAAWQRVSNLPVASAGTRPAERVHPRAVKIGHRHGLDLSPASPRRLEDVGDGKSSLLVAVCDNAHEELAHVGLLDDRDGVWLHWHVSDPVPADTDQAFEAAYAQIAERVDRLAAALADTPRAF